MESKNILLSAGVCDFRLGLSSKERAANFSTDARLTGKRQA